jgi:hypothetical protein
MEPQFAPLAAQVVGLHSHLLRLPLAAQVSGAVHLPQSRVPPHPSGARPHWALSIAHVFGLQPQTFGSTALHVAGSVQDMPQVIIAPQWSSMVPQFLPCIAQVVGVQPHLIAFPAPPHVFGATQTFWQTRILPHPSET